MNLRKNGWSMERDGGRKDVTGKKKSWPQTSQRALKTRSLLGNRKFKSQDF